MYVPAFPNCVIEQFKIVELDKNRPLDEKKGLDKNGLPIMVRPKNSRGTNEIVI